MSFQYNKNLKPYAQKLRREMTPEESKLWYRFLCRLPVKVRRQKMIGCYIVDFYCASKKTVIELDGSQHFEPDGQTSDGTRDEYLKGLGLSVIRYPNNEVDKNFDGVCEDIMHRLELTL